MSRWTCFRAPIRVNPDKVKSVRVDVYLEREVGRWWTHRLCTLMAIPGQNGIGRSDWGWVSIFYSAEQYNQVMALIRERKRHEAIRNMHVILFTRWHYVFNNMFDADGERV